MRWLVLGVGYTRCQAEAWSYSRHVSLLSWQAHFTYYDVHFLYTTSNISHFKCLITKTCHYRRLFLCTNYSPMDAPECTNYHIHVNNEIQDGSANLLATKMSATDLMKIMLVLRKKYFMQWWTFASLQHGGVINYPWISVQCMPYLSHKG